MAKKKVNVAWSSPARQNLKDIIDFVRADSPEAARQLGMRIRESVSHLSAFPEMGKLLDLVDPPAREIFVGNYRIVYDYSRDQNQVYILAIFDTRRDPNRLFEMLIAFRSS